MRIHGPQSNQQHIKTSTPPDVLWIWDLDAKGCPHTRRLLVPLSLSNGKLTWERGSVAISTCPVAGFARLTSKVDTVSR